MDYRNPFKMRSMYVNKIHETSSFLISDCFTIFLRYLPFMLFLAGDAIDVLTSPLDFSEDKHGALRRN